MGSNYSSQIRGEKERRITVVAHFGQKTYEIQVKEGSNVQKVVQKMIDEHDNFAINMVSMLCCQCRKIIPCWQVSLGRYRYYSGYPLFFLKDQDGNVVNKITDGHSYELWLHCHEGRMGIDQ